MSRNIKPTNWVSAQRRLRSAWASAQSDKNLRCPREESLGPELHTKRTAKTDDQTGRMPQFVGCVVSRLILVYILSKDRWW